MRPLILACPGCAGAWTWPGGWGAGEGKRGAGSDAAPTADHAPAPAGDASAARDAAHACPRCGHVLRVRGGLLELDELPGPSEYPPALSASDAAVDAHDWWYASRTRWVLHAVSRWQRARGRAGRALELGCGSGLVLAALERLGWDVVGVDGNAEGLRVARTRTRAPLLRSGAGGVPLAEPVDLAVLCDVLEHADEAELLAPLRAALAPDGALLLTVPARPSLWSAADVAVGHRRRYTPESLRAALRAQGFALPWLRPFHAWLTPLAWWAARRAGPPPGPEQARVELLAARRTAAPGAGRLPRLLCAAERAVGRHLPLPFGSHLVALATRA